MLASRHWEGSAGQMSSRPSCSAGSMPNRPRTTKCAYGVDRIDVLDVAAARPGVGDPHVDSRAVGAKGGADGRLDRRPPEIDVARFRSGQGGQAGIAGGHPLHAPADGPPVAAREQVHARPRLEAVMREHPAHGPAALRGAQEPGVDGQIFFPRLRMAPPDAVLADRAQASLVFAPQLGEDLLPRPVGLGAIGFYGLGVADDAGQPGGPIRASPTPWRWARPPSAPCRWNRSSSIRTSRGTGRRRRDR